MRRKRDLAYNLMLIALALAAGAILAATADAQTVRYGGRIYSGNSVCCNNRSCGMRASILGMRRRIQQRSRIVAQPSRTIVGYRTELQKFGCVDGVCQYRNVRIPIYGAAVASPSTVVIHDRPTVVSQPPLSPTPHDVIESIFSVVKPRKGSTWIDAGSGDGRVVIAAAKAGCHAIGIEISHSRVDSSRAAIEAAGGRVLKMDATKYDYRYADYVFLYQHLDVLSKVVAKLRPHATIVSYQHRIPGMKNRVFRRASDGATFYVAIKPDAQTFQEVTR